MKYKLLIGANAYVCVEESGVRHDILLFPGHGVTESLRMYATGKRNDAAQALESAERAERLIALIEKEKESENV